MNRIPTLTSATCNEINSPPIDKSGPQGITALVNKAVNMAIPGPKINNHLSAFAGIKSSLKNILPASARGCNIPHGPALSGPILSCNQAATLRSISVKYAAIPKVTANNTTINMILLNILLIC